MDYYSKDVFSLKGQDIKSISSSGITYDNVDAIYNNILSLKNSYIKLEDKEVPKVGPITMSKINFFDAESIKEILVNFSKFKKYINFSREVTETQWAREEVDIGVDSSSIDTTELDWDYDECRNSTEPVVEDEKIRCTINLPEIKYFNFNYFNKKVA